MSSQWLKLLVPALVFVAAGCAIDSRVTQLSQVGPDPVLASQNSGAGFLQVYSARERVPIDVNAEEFFWNNDYGKNEFLHYAAHTGYVLRALDGSRLQQVRNASGMNDANPTAVKLSPGVYTIEAVAEDYDDVAMTVRVPVLVKPGLTTVVHLDGNWHPAVTVKNSDQMVRLPNGHIVGWQAVKPDNPRASPGANS